MTVPTITISATVRVRGGDPSDVDRTARAVTETLGAALQKAGEPLRAAVMAASDTGSVTK
jgi:hypothetical protein